MTRTNGIVDRKVPREVRMKEKKRVKMDVVDNRKKDKNR